MHHNTVKAATKLDATLRAEYGLYAEIGDDSLEIYTLEHDQIVGSYYKCPTLAQVLEDYEDHVVTAEEEEAALAAEEAEEEEEQRVGSVVNGKYKALYREMGGNPHSCSDWLADFLDDYCHDANDKLDFDAFIELCELNDVRPSAKLQRSIDAQTRGWQGRARMTLRRQLEVVIVINGVIYFSNHKGEKKMAPPTDKWMKEMREKHRRHWILFQN